MERSHSMRQSSHHYQSLRLARSSFGSRWLSGRRIARLGRGKIKEQSGDLAQAEGDYSAAIAADLLGKSGVAGEAYTRRGAVRTAFWRSAASRCSGTVVNGSKIRPGPST